MPVALFAPARGVPGHGLAGGAELFLIGCLAQAINDSGAQHAKRESDPEISQPTHVLFVIDPDE